MCGEAGDVARERRGIAGDIDHARGPQLCQRFDRLTGPGARRIEDHGVEVTGSVGRILAWNSHDLERILALYAEDSEMTSDRIQALGLEASGTLRGKESLRMYWSKAFALLPNLHFDLIDTYVSPDSVVVFYQNERGAQICEYLRLDAKGKIRQGSANHLAH